VRQLVIAACEGSEHERYQSHSNHDKGRHFFVSIRLQPLVAGERSAVQLLTVA
jgi:hypothetical protein